MIKLTDKYFIGADNYNWILYKKGKSKKTDEDKFYGWKFYPTLEKLLTDYLDMGYRVEDMSITDLKELVMMLYTSREKTAEIVRESVQDFKKEWLLNNDWKRNTEKDARISSLFINCIKCIEA